MRERTFVKNVNWCDKQRVRQNREGKEAENQTDKKTRLCLHDSSKKEKGRKKFI